MVQISQKPHLYLDRCDISTEEECQSLMSSLSLNYLLNTFNQVQVRYIL